MPLRQLHLEVATLDDLSARVRAECGPEAEIIAAEKVTVGGIKGFLARQHFEVTVLVPDVRAGAHVISAPAKAGIAALLDDADEAEADLQQQAAVSTNSSQFDELLNSLSFTEPPTSPSRIAIGARPTLMSKPGDLVALVGIWRDPLRVARSIALSAEATVCIAGAVIAPGTERVENRRSALDARAVGVRNGRGTFVALGLGSGRSGIAESAATLKSIAADQVWVVVDASRKPEDTAEWVDVIAKACAVEAMAVLGRQDTSTPDSVNALGLPVGWVDGASVG